MYITPISIRKYNICLLCELNAKGYQFCDPIKKMNGKNRLLVCNFFVPLGVSKDEYEIMILDKLYRNMDSVVFGEEDEEDQNICDGVGEIDIGDDVENFSFS